MRPPIARPGNPQNIAVWLDLMRTADKLLLAGLRHKIGPEGDVREAYREWYSHHMDKHEQAVRQMIRRLREAERKSNDAR